MADDRTTTSPPDEAVDPVGQALAAVTCWLDGDRDLGRRQAAVALERDPIGFLDAVAGLWTVVGDVARESEVDLQLIVRDVALGVAQARTEDR
ncbi:hypothetical protein FTX61_10910 [Nitriliruptoraceae bacterium ZYF776]|nr:hypothetical protein [Profundirhabdus halotolerans]